MRRFGLGRVVGIPIEIDASWFVILALLTWTLATSYFPFEVAGPAPWGYWLMGLLGAVLLFTCVLLHELGHSLVAKRYGIPVKRVTLFVFGGVAQIGADPERAWVEFAVALAGPLVSVAIVVACTLTTRLWVPQRAGELIAFALTRYLQRVNLAIIIFNSLPGFPLDGGRVLRAVLWGWSKNLVFATRIASFLGNLLGLVLIALGLFFLVKGRLINGLWYGFLGSFLRDAARTSYHQALLRQASEDARSGLGPRLN